MRDRAGATPRTFWAAESRKSGVAPARFSVFSSVTFHLTEFPISCSSKKLLAQRVKNLVKTRLKCVFVTFFTRLALNYALEHQSVPVSSKSVIERESPFAPGSKEEIGG
jgi:hypothetical protein